MTALRTLHVPSANGTTHTKPRIIDREVGIPVDGSTILFMSAFKLVHHSGAEEELLVFHTKLPFPKGIPIAVRVDSGCLVGALLGARETRCDCHSQFLMSLDYLETSGQPGVTVHVKDDDGKRNGLVTKFRAYHEASRTFPVAQDLRQYDCAIAVLLELELGGPDVEVHLMSNSPHKQACLNAGGLNVRRFIPMVSMDPRHRVLLTQKALLQGHLIPAELLEPEDS